MPSFLLQQRARRVLFGLYAAGLFTATHWPKVDIQGPLPRTDLWLHVGAFGAWTLLAIACGFFGPALSARNLLGCAVMGAAYAGVDEGLQALPFVQRTCAWDDFAADCLGVLLAIILAVTARIRRYSPP